MEKTPEKSPLEKLKEDYSKIQKKHNLPSFNELNRDFKIEKLADIETDFLIREIRSQIGEGLENFLRFVEAILNPVNVPMFLFPVIKSLDEKEKEKLNEFYKKLSKLEIKGIKLINYSEEKEIELLKESFELWQEIKKDFTILIENIEKKLEVKTEKSERGYFG